MCGLYGFVNNGNGPFRYDLFTVLGIANDRRGGDSCGVFIDGQVEYGIGQKALFENFFWDSKLLNNTTECVVALGHDRKASVGGITVEKAHPILIKNEEGKIDFVLVHNGTIYNYEELAKEYIPDIEIKGLSDSQILALIFYHKGFDVLGKYNGGTAFVAVDYRSGNPRTFIFKGASKNTSVSKEEEIERPLYFAYNKERLIFSSIASYLCALLSDTVYEVKDNIVYEYSNGQLFIYKKIDRSKCQQTKSYTINYPAYNGYSNYSNNYNNNYKFEFIRYNDANNTYVGEDGKLLHGKYRISQYGRIIKPNDKSDFENIKTYVVFFFNGIPLRDKFTFNTINKSCKKSGLSIDAYTQRNLTAIRFYSIDPVFIELGKYYKAVSEVGFTPYNGSLYIIGRASGKQIKDGTYSSYLYNVDYDEFFKKGDL